MLNNVLTNAGLKQLFAEEEVYLINNKFGGKLDGNAKHIVTENELVTDKKITEKDVNLINKTIAKTETTSTKTVLIIVDKLTDTGKSFLEKILGAVNLDFNKVDLQELEPGNSKTFGEYLKGNEGIVKTLIFGVPLSDLGFKSTLENYSIQQLKHIQFLSTDKLSAIEADQNLKRKLWGCLQEMYKK